MLRYKVLAAAIAAVVLSVSTSFAQYKGPPIIIQTPQLPPPTLTQPPLTTLPLTGTLTPVPAPTPVVPPAPAQAAPARP
jgi:hypothetical protein